MAAALLLVVHGVLRLTLHVSVAALARHPTASAAAAAAATRTNQTKIIFFAVTYWTVRHYILQKDFILCVNYFYFPRIFPYI